MPPEKQSSSIDLIGSLRVKLETDIKSVPDEPPAKNIAQDEPPTKNIAPDDSPAGGVVPNDPWAFLPKQEPAREHAKKVIKKAAQIIADEAKYDPNQLRHGGSLSASAIASIADDESLNWWERQDREDPPTQRKMAEHISKWLKSGQPDPKTMPI
ncbi:MAG: hypothetical protein HQL86_00125 [Magnetococcales bacterium]|nr:hypothetical protein [Magnetococcales bacterium]